MMMRWWNAPISDWALYTAFFYYTRLYGAQIFMLTVLSAMTVYRREMSCNHVYTEEDEENDDDDTHRESETRRKGAESSSGQQRPILPSFWDDRTELLLEGAGNYCSGEPLLAVVLSLWDNLFVGSLYCLTPGRPSRDGCSPSRPLKPRYASAARTHYGDSTMTGQGRYDAPVSSSDILTKELPTDVQVHVLSYLHPRDVVTFACTSRSCTDIVDEGDSAMALWKTLWHRDYAWIVLSWGVGQKALRRSQESLDVRFDKDFYFVFGQSYLNYVLAGQNTADHCLVGLHGHIYDITPFLDTHPGSPDTLMVHSGRDSTAFFEGINHSVGARRLTRSFCVVLDALCLEDGCGLHPTKQTTGQCALPPAMDGVTVPLDGTKRPRRAGTLQRIRAEYEIQQERRVKRVTRRFLMDPNVLSNVNVYYDPFCMEWRAWYTDHNLQTVFVGQI